MSRKENQESRCYCDIQPHGFDLSDHLVSLSFNSLDRHQCAFASAYYNALASAPLNLCLVLLEAPRFEGSPDVEGIAGAF